MALRTILAFKKFGGNLSTVNCFINPPSKSIIQSGLGLRFCSHMSNLPSYGRFMFDEPNRLIFFDGKKLKRRPRFPSTSIDLSSKVEFSYQLYDLGCSFKNGIMPNGSTYNKLLNGFIREDKTHEADRLFKKMIKNQLCEPNIVTYNTMIKGLCKIGNNFTAVALLRLMDGRGCEPDVYTYNTIIHSLCQDIISIDDAFKLFAEMKFNKVLRPNVVTYNSLIYALCKLGRWDEVTAMLEHMEDERVSPTVRTFNIIVDALCKEGKAKDARFIFDILGRSDEYPPDLITHNSLIAGYCLQGEMTNARTIFDYMVFRGIKPNVVTYNTLMDGYIKDMKIDEAIEIYNVINMKVGKRINYEVADLDKGCVF